MTDLNSELQFWPSNGAKGCRLLQLKPFPIPRGLFRLPATASGPPVCLEPFLNRQRQLRVLAAFPAGTVASINGAPAPGLAVLAPGDNVEWAPNHCFRVVLLSRPVIGPPSDKQLGRECPVCRVPLSPESVCVSCSCGVAVHCESTADGLQCAQLARACPVCQRPIVFEETLLHAPTDED